MYGYQNYQESPDIVTMAKPLANGLPLGAVVVGGHVADIMKPGDHGTTFGGGPLATRVGQYVWNTIRQPEFLNHITEMGLLIEKRGKELVKMSPLVKEIRGKGLLMGMELRESVPTQMFVDLCREKGVLVVSAGSNTIRLIPALIVTSQEIEEVFKVFESVIFEMEGILASGKQ
jgi:acetylornithine aminotransferase/acetylornithine/N-succinyldiaminopimelate aminotransferase